MSTDGAGYVHNPVFSHAGGGCLPGAAALPTATASDPVTPGPAQPASEVVSEVQDYYNERDEAEDEHLSAQLEYLAGEDYEDAFNAIGCPSLDNVRRWEQAEFPYDMETVKFLVRAPKWEVPFFGLRLGSAYSSMLSVVLIAGLPVLWGSLVSAARLSRRQRAYFDGCVNLTDPAAAARPTEQLPWLPYSLCLACNGNPWVQVTVQQSEAYIAHFMSFFIFVLIQMTLVRLLLLRGAALLLLARGVRVRSMLCSCRTIASLLLITAAIAFFCHLVLNVHLELVLDGDLGRSLQARTSRACSNGIIGRLRPVFHPDNPALPSTGA